MKKKFKCSSCKKEFDMKERGYFSWSQGSICKTCSEKIRKMQEKNERMYKLQEEKEFEDKIRKIVNKVLDERDDKRK